MFTWGFAFHDLCLCFIYFAGRGDIYTQVATLNVIMTLKSETSSVTTNRNILSFTRYLNIYSFNKYIISLTDIYSFLGRQKSHVFKLSYNAMDI